MTFRRDVEAGRLGRELQFESCLACGQVCEITGTFDLPGLGGTEPYVRTRCVAGHLFVGPACALRTAE
jgi:hypothetical protein